MKEIAAVMIVLAFAGANVTRQRRLRYGLFETPNGIMEVLNSHGDVVGEIKCQQQEFVYSGSLTDITGNLPDLPPGDYLSAVHESDNYNKSCNSAGPLMKRLKDNGHWVMWSPFPMITVKDESHNVESFPGVISFNRSSTLYLPGRLVLFYSLPRNSTIWFDGPSETNKLPPAAACGVLVDETPVYQ